MLRRFRMALFATLVILALTIPGLGSAATPAEDHGAKPTPAQGDYRIGPEDVLDIAVWNNASLSRTVPVRPDGKISLPLLNDVQADAGRRPKWKTGEHTQDWMSCWRCGVGVSGW